MTTRKKTQKSTQQALNTGAQMFGRQPYTTVEDVKGTPNMVEQSMPPPTKAWTPTNWKQWDKEQQENQYQSEFEKGRRYDTENKPIDTNLQTPLYQMSQQEQINRASESSKKIFSDMEVGMTVSDLIKKGEKDAAAAAREVQSKTSPYVDDNGFSAFATLRTANEARTPSKLVKDFQNGLQDKMEYLVYSHSKEIEDGAKDARMDVPTYIDKYVVPQYLSQIETSLRDEVRKGYMPKSDFEYIMSGVKDWVPGMLVRIATQTGEQYALEDEAKQQYGDKASWGVKALNEGMAFVDPTFAGAFGAGRVAGKTIQSAVTSGVNRAVQTKIGQKLAPVAVQKAADYATKFGTGAQAAMAKLIDRSGSSRVGSFLKTYSKELPAEIIGQSLGMNLYGSLSGGVSTYGQTRDIYEAGKVAWEGLTSKEGVASGTAFAIGMPILHNLYGLSGLEWKAGDSLLKKTVMGGAKLAYEGASVLGTAGVMTAGHNLGYFLNGEDMDWTLNTFMEQTTTAAAMKYNPNLLKRLSQWPKMLKNMGSKETNNPLPFRLEKEEVDMILDLTHTETLSDALYTIFPDLGKASGKLRDVDARVTEARKNYLRLMNQLPWDTANKINMLTGSMTIARPRAASYEYNGKKLMEIGEDGSILSVKEVTSREQAEAYIAEKKIAQNNADLVKSWFDAYRNNKDEMDRRVDAFEQEHNLKPGTLYSILLSDPMSRIGTNRELILEQAAMQMQDLFRPRGKAHVDQSRIEGENVANDADILGATPNVEAIRALDAEVDREQANFESALTRAPWRKEYQSLKGKGMSDADALATLSDKYKEADLAPLADFVNAQAKQEGFLSAVGHSVDSKVSERVNTLTYRMDDKGEKVQHDDVIELVDADGNIVHLVGGVSGKTSVVNGKEYLDGDLMVIVDANGETHAVKTSDYSINRRLAKSDYDAEYREALGVKATQIIDPTEKLNPERIKQESLKKESAKEESAKEPLKTEEPVKEELAEEPVKEEKPVEEEPRDERGDLDFVNERVTPDRAVEEIYDLNGLTEAEAGDFVAEKKAEAEKLYTEASNEPVTRNTGEGLSEFAQRKAEYNAKVEGLKRNLEKWNQIETAAERRNMTKTGAELTAMDLDARERDIKRQTEERVDELAKKLGDVEKVYDISEVTNPDALAELRAGRTVYGWYDKKKDKVVLYMPNVTNPRAAIRTIVHEQVIHRGLSKMFGEDYDNVLAEVYDKVMTPSEQKEFYEYVNGPKEGKAEDIRKKQLEAADEWIANNHESLRFKQYNVWSNLISSVRGILRKNGFDVDYTRRDIENLVRDSYRNLEKSGAREVKENTSQESGVFGNIYTQFKGKAKEAIDFLMKKKDGEAIGALHHKDIGDISIVWGNAKAGLQKIAQKHPEVLDNLQEIFDTLEVISRTDNRIKLESDTHFAVVSREFFGTPRSEWLLTAYEKKETSKPTNSSMDVDSNPMGKSDDTATRQSLDVSSVDKVTAISSSDQKTGSDLTNVSENETRFSKSNENQRIFVSNAEKAVEGIKQEKGTPEQWLKMIEKGGGLKAGEDKWMGLSDWLKEHKGKSITKQEVLDFIRENQIQIEEVKYEQFGEGLIDEATGKLDAELKEIGWEAMCEKYPGIEELFETHNGELVWSEERASVGEYEDFIIDNKIVNVNPDSNAINETRLNYTTEGLDNKREIALTIPTIEPYNSHDEIHFGDAGEGRAVAWIRFGETTTESGERVLVIDEIQSKRHQEAREEKPDGKVDENGKKEKKGYRDDAKIAQMKEQIKALEAEQQQIAKDILHKQGYRFHDEEEGKFSYEEEYSALSGRIGSPAQMARQKEIDTELYNLNHSIREMRKGIPAAPFENNWHELAMKRMLRYAAENGYDVVAWTKGEQQAERYNIGEVVNRIESNDTVDYDSKLGVDLVKQVVLFTRDGNAITLRLTPEGIVRASSQYNGHHISDIVGKELGNRIMTETDLVLKEQDLRIGGEGMKGFYDKMLPSFMNKYGKKWGTKVGEVELPDVEEAGRTMWSVDVTPEMKESVMQGQTMFSKAMETELDKAFNEKLSTLNDENKDKIVFDLGRPSKVLLDAGVSDKPMKLYGNKVIKKQKKHGFDLSELKGLPSAIADPIAVFDNYNKDNNRSILTELRTEQGNFLVALDLGKDGDIDFNIIRSVFGKGKEKVSTWLQRGIATYINNQKVKDFLSHPSAPIAAAAAKLSPSDAAKVNKIGELNKLLGEKLYVRTKNFKDWFGDWEKNPKDASKTVDENGEPMTLWHETGNDFTVFNPRHEGAGTRDYLTPFGIFLKPSPSPIGVAREGEAKQMALYANIRNPIEFANRKELDDYLRSNCEGYAQAADAIKNIDAEYGKRLDDAERIEDEAMMDIYRNHPEIWNDDAKRMEAYEKHSAESTRILEEWKGAVNRQSEALKEITDKFFRNSGHDGIVLKSDEGSFGRKTKTYIAFHPNQVKSATGNVGTFSRENDDIRFSKKVYGGNSGYVGYSMSKRAALARKEGRFPKTDFKKEYGVTGKALDALVKAKVISDNEWHHTSMYGNKTTFYEWGEKEYADFYAENKKEIDDMARKGDIDGISAKFEAYDEQLPELRKAEEERIKAERDETLRLQKEYNEYLDDAVDIPSEYTAENGVRIETNGSRKPADWKYFWGDKPAFRNYGSKAMEEFSKVVGDKMKDLPSFEEWRKNKFQEQNVSVAGTESMRAVDSSGTMFSVRPLLGDKNLHKGLRDLKEGEKSHVERVFTENKNFEFSSMNKVESYSDIAYIFRQLEDEAIENSFAVLVKKGKPTVIHLGTGNYTATMVSNSALNVAVNRVNPDKIYFVHNHPSGNLKASRQDEDVLSNLRKMYGPKVADGIIINARSGRYGIYTPSSLHTGADYDVNHGLSDTSNARPIKVYSFSKQVFSPDYQPDALITSSDDVAKFVSSHRLGDRQKLGLIISNSKGAITGNIFLPYSEITKENARDIANDIAYYTSVVGGTRAFMFGNVPLRDVEYKGLSLYVTGFSNLHLLDYVEIDGGRHKSACDEGIRFRFAKTPEEFESVQKEAVEKKGIVMDGLKDKVLNVVDVPRHDFTGTGNEAIHKARKWAKENLLGEYVAHENTDEEFRYSIDIKAIKKYLSGIGIEASDNLGVHLSVLKVLPDVIENSIEAEIHADYKKVDSRNIDNGIGDENLLIHRFYGGVNIDGKLYRVKTTLKEKKNDGVKPYTYEVKNIELLGGSSQKGTSPSNAPNNSISAAKLLNGVEKSYDKGKKLLAESKTLTPVNQNAAFRKDYKAEKAQTEDRLLKGNHRETLGKGYTGFVRNLWENKGNPLYKEMHAYVNKEMQKNGFDVNKGVESYLVSKIGSNDRAFWENVRDAYAEGMKEAGNDWKPNLVDVQYGLWLSSKKGNMNDPLFKAEAVAMRDKIAKSLPPVEVVDGAYVDTDTRFRKPVLTPAAQAARDEYDRRVSSQVSRSREAFIDAMESLRVFQEVVGGKDVEDLKNAYVRENLESSIAHVEWEKYQERINKPLSQAVDKIITYMGVGGREGMKQITDYMIQKHGLERNRVMYVRDAIRDIDNPKKAEQMQTDWDTDQAMLRGLLSSGSISFSEYLDMTDTYIRDNVDADYDPNKNDKSGISTYDSNRKLKGKNVEYDESYIRDLVETFESEIGTSDMQNLWDRVREATGFTLDYSYKSGMITAGARDAMKNMFSFYVPLRGYSAETMEEHYGDYLSGGSGKDLNVIKNAEGRKSEADNPLAYIANMAQGAILSGEKNVTKQHFYRLVEGNDKAPVAISEIWEVKNPQGVWEIATPDLTGARLDEIADIVHTFNEDMRNLQQNGDARIAQYQSSYRFPFEQKAHREEHIVPVNIGGQRKLIYILADPRVAQALNGKLVNDGTANTFKLGRQALNVMSTFATSYSPEFILSNTSRDTLFANSNIASKENAAYFGKFTKNQAKAAQILSIPNLFSEYYNGTWDKSNYYRRMFAEFMDNGGRTGFIAMSKVEDMKKQLEKELTPNSTNEEVARKVGDFLKVVPGWVEAVNARSENLNRFATYLTSREMGRSEQRSASDAKEVSVNFNRKGAGSATGGVTGAVASYFRNNMMFFNAGMQATELMYRNLSKDKKTAAKTVAFQALVPMTGSAIWAALMTLGDDDKYSQIPHWDRRNNVCIPLKDTYIKIPLPVELRAFWGMGDIIAGAIDKKLQTGDNVMYELASQAASVMPLDVMGQNQEQLTKWWHVVEALSPDFVNPVFQANRNMTWNGRPIERDDDFLPAYEKAFANTPTLLVEMSKYAHAKTREGEHTAQDTDLTGWQISPGIVHHFLGSYLTGIYSLTLKTASAGTDIANGEFNVARTPFVSRVLGSYKTGEGSAVIRAKYYKYKKEYDEVAREYNNMANRTNELAMQELLNSARYKRHLVAKGYMGFISKLQELNNQATDPEAKKEISALIDNAMADIVEATDSIE